MSLKLFKYILLFVCIVFLLPAYEQRMSQRQRREGQIRQRHMRDIAFCFGTTCGIGVSIWVRLAAGHLYDTYFIYIVAGLYGISSSALLVTSLGITADLIGQDLNNGAFIYGLMSFVDKLSNGAAVMAIQAWSCSPTCQTHYRDSLAYVCGVAALVGSFAVLTLSDMNPEKDEESKTRKDEENNSHVAVNA